LLRRQWALGSVTSTVTIDEALGHVDVPEGRSFF
jgi:hypothetical protein